MTPERTLAALAAHVVTPVIRERDATRARRVVTALRRAGFRVFEVTLTVPGAVSLISELAAAPDIIVGVGTVFTADEASHAVAAGARFVVSPAVVPAIAAAAHAGGAAAILGALTPTEVVSARAAGADAVKIFPVDSVGGPKHLKALRSVFPDVPLLPTGGVDLDNLGAYLTAGAHSVGVGGALSGAGDADAIETLGRRYLQAAAPHASMAPNQGETPR